ncbi:hypothetical protein [Vibrio phage VCPH]|nr:hypothetical protein [Vibrio phage VCPH]
MFAKLVTINAFGILIPKGNNMKSAIYAHCYGASLKTIHQRYGISKRRLKKAINAGKIKRN